jgi:hypothetical protein
MRLVALGMAISAILAVPVPARAQSETALSAVGFPIIGGSAIEVSSVRPASGAAVQASMRDAAMALSRGGAWSATSVVLTGAVATLVLRDASGVLQASVRVPARAASAVGLRTGESVRTTATGTILHKAGKVVAFVAHDDQRHLVTHLASR